MSGEPREAIGALRERVWSKLVSKAALSEYQQRYTVLSTRLVGGQPLIHVYSEAPPEDGFEPVDRRTSRTSTSGSCARTAAPRRTPERRRSACSANSSASSCATSSARRCSG